MAKKQADKVRPVEEVRIGGVKAAIWRNEGGKGIWFNVSFQRLYRTAEEQWQSTEGFALGDLLLLGKVADAVHTRVLQLLAEQRAGSQAAGPIAERDIPY